MARSVASKADVKDHVSPSPTSGSNSGAWATTAPVNIITDPRLTLARKPVALSASQSFTFTPAPDNKSVGNQTSIVLKAKPSKITVGQQHVLLDGDVLDDASASLSRPPNDISVSSPSKLRVR